MYEPLIGVRFYIVEILMCYCIYLILIYSRLICLDRVCIIFLLSRIEIEKILNAWRLYTNRSINEKINSHVHVKATSEGGYRDGKNNVTKMTAHLFYEGSNFFTCQHDNITI